MSSFRFDPASRSLQDLDRAGDLQVLCAHLAPALETLIGTGSRVIAVSVKSWSAVDVAITLDRGPAPTDLLDRLAGTPDVRPWVNRDTHYPLESGLVCARCRQAIAWPLSE